MKKLVAVLACAMLFAPFLRAQDPKSEPENKPDNKAEEKFPAPPAEEKSVKTQHTVQINGRELHYTAVAGTLLLRKENGKPKASIFYVAYTADGADASKRPITFAFNGGPGSSSVWLHIGALGPRRVPLSSEGLPVAPPYKLVDNPDTALSYTDLIFIDPVTTGFSRNAPGEDPHQFHGLEGDLDSVSDFIRLYLTRGERWASPKYLAGESYGTTRAAGLSQYLIEHHGIYLNGITLISSVLNFQTLSFGKNNDLPYIVFLPSYTATAWYHKKLSADLQNGTLEDAVKQSRQFASGPYAQALLKGSAISETERNATAEQVARLTGLRAAYVADSNLRIEDQRFMKELLRSEKKTIGRFDSRLEGMDQDAISERPEYDPSYASVLGPYTAAFNQYIRKELNWQSDLPYEILTDKVQPWNFSAFVNAYVDVSERLATAMSANPFMKVLQMNGYYDLATPFFATEYTFDHMEISPTARKNIQFGYCGAGHMVYLKESCLTDLHREMSSIY
jgi:carboxypeptidase C (cathepsin A)